MNWEDAKALVERHFQEMRDELGEEYPLAVIAISDEEGRYRIATNIERDRLNSLMSHFVKTGVN